MRLDKRVEALESKGAPAAFRNVQLVCVMTGQTEEEACAEYDQPISEEDMLILLVGKEPLQCLD